MWLSGRVRSEANNVAPPTVAKDVVDLRLRPLLVLLGVNALQRRHDSDQGHVCYTGGHNIHVLALSVM